MLKIETLKTGRLESNCYILYDDDLGNAFIIDPGDDADFIMRRISDSGVVPQKIIATHGHFDHNMAAYELQSAYKAPYLISEKDHPLLKKMPVSAKYFLNINSVIVPKSVKFLRTDKKLEIGKSFFEIMETPGHTPGSIGLYNPMEKIYFSGDTIFKDGSIGRYDFSYSDKKDIFLSLKKILSLPADTVIYPGHGGKTTVGAEKFYHN
jgi:hydroxyacylglutathione hydrolase